MDTDLGHIWDQTLEAMEKELLKPSFEAWLKNTHPLDFDGNTLTIAVPNQFTRDWIETRYVPMLCKTLRYITGQKVGIAFSILEVDPSTASSENPRHEHPNGGGKSKWREAPPTTLNPRYTFDSFVVGTSNRFANAACQAVAEAPAKTYNPLFIYGGVGLGKTHLMQAIGHSLYLNNPSIKVVYVSSETFTNELIMAIRDGRTVDFRNRYRNIDVLLLDDVQFVGGKESTQEEFFHTFDALHQSAKQIVLSSDRPPKEISTLEERLRTRFQWGLIADIQAPDLETRIAILRKKAESQHLSLPEEVIGYVALNIETNIRELEGSLIRVVAYSSLTSRPIDVELAKEALRDIVPDQRPRVISLELIQKHVADYYDLRVEDLKAKKRSRALSFPRHVAMYLCRKLTSFSLPRVGEEFGGRDHTTVIHACEKITKDIKMNPSLHETVQLLEKEILGQT